MSQLTSPASNASPVQNGPTAPNNPHLAEEEEVFQNWLLSLFNVTDSTTSLSDGSSESGAAGDGVGVHHRPSTRSLGYASFTSNQSSTYSVRLGASQHSATYYSDQPVYHNTSERGIASSSSTMDVSTDSSHLDMMLDVEDVDMASSTGDTIARNRSVAMSVSDGDSYDADGETSSDNEGEDVVMRNDIIL